MGSEGASASDYDPLVLSRMTSEAARVLRSFGFAGGHVVIVGGLVPSLLVPKPDAGIEPHIGTTDLDVCLSVALVDGEVGSYERLETSLKQAGFQMAKENGHDVSWRWRGGVDLPVTLEFFCPAAGDRPAGKLYRPGGVVGGKLSAMALSAGRLIDTDVRDVSLEVDLPQGGGRTTHTFKVAGPAAYLASKLDALRNRTKNKDAYDVIWLIEGWPGGQKALAEEIKRSPVFGAPEFRDALEGLRREFETIDSAGAVKYAAFMADDVTPRDAFARRAVGALAALLTELGG